MNVNYSNLTSRADCQFLIQEVEKQKRILNNKIETLRIKDSSAEDRAQARQNEILRLTAELASVENMLQHATGAERQRYLDKQVDLQYKLSRLNRSHSSNGIIADVERDYDIGLLEAQLSIAADFISGITTHMNAIPE